MLPTAPCEVRKSPIVRPSKSARRSFRRQCITWYRGFNIGCSPVQEGKSARPARIAENCQPEIIDRGICAATLAAQCKAGPCIQRFARGWAARLSTKPQLTTRMNRSVIASQKFSRNSHDDKSVDKARPTIEAHEKIGHPYDRMMPHLSTHHR